MKTLAVCAALVLLALGAATVGCDEHEHEGAPSGAVCEPGAPTYDSFGRAFMESYCTRCHSSTLSGAARQGAPADHDFDTYLGVIAVADHVDEHAAAGPTIVNEEMPPSAPKPTLEERRKLGAWLACELAFLADGGVPDGL
jgi:cytochrome c5